MKNEGMLRGNGKRFLVVALLFMCCVLVVGITIYMVNDVHNIATTEHSEKCIKTVQIKYGDTLWTIAEDNLSEGYTIKSLIDEICEINGLLDADSIHEGNYIIVPYYNK